MKCQQNSGELTLPQRGNLIFYVIHQKRKKSILARKLILKTRSGKIVKTKIDFFDLSQTYQFMSGTFYPFNMKEKRKKCQNQCIYSKTKYQLVLLSYYGPTRISELKHSFNIDIFELFIYYIGWDRKTMIYKETALFDNQLNFLGFPEVQSCKTWFTLVTSRS